MPAIKGRNREIPQGLVGEIRRTVAGTRFDIDHRHTELEFDLIVRGSGTFTLDEESYILKPGTLVWLLPGKRHRLVRSPNLEMWVVTVRPEMFEVDHVKELGMRPSSLLPGNDLIDLDRLLSQIAQDSDEPSIYNAGIVYATRRVIRASRDSPSAHRRPMHPAVGRALLLLRQSGAALSLPELAKEAGVTPPYLSRLLVEHTARSFVDWRNRIRLEQFMSVYRAGDSLPEIAIRAGFGSYGRFNRVFKEIVGCAPKDWAARGDAEAIPADAGIPQTVALSGRQRWTRLMPCLGSSIASSFGQHLLKLLLDAPQTRHPEPKHLHHLDGKLPAQDRKRLIAALRQRDSDSASDLADVLASVDFADTYKGIVEFYGFSTSSLGDALTALLMVLWVSAHHAPDPSIEQAGPVRRQVQALLVSAAPDARTAQTLLSASIIAFVVAFHALQAARASGDPHAFHELREAALLCAHDACGGDFAAIALTPSGLTPREHGGSSEPKARAGQA